LINYGFRQPHNLSVVSGVYCAFRSGFFFFDIYCA